MALICLLVLGPSVVWSAGTDDDSNDTVRVWAAVAYINHGERTPPSVGQQTVLTPDGAQQMWRQGRAFRERYLAGNADDTRGREFAPAQGMAKDAVDNSQLTVLSKADEWVVAGAMAFMQGLYPPHTHTQAGAADDQVPFFNHAGGGNSTDYPLRGYQYPLIQTVRRHDPSYIGLQGDVACPEWQSEIETSFDDSPEIQRQVQRHKGYYQALFSKPPLQGLIPLEQASYQNAAAIYELVRFMHTYNTTVFKGLDHADETLDALQALAFSAERAKTVHDNSTDGNDDALNVLYGIAGRTLASLIAGELVGMFPPDGANNKMTLLFGSARPLLSFFSLAGLVKADDGQSSGPFARLPEPGAAIIVEIVSPGDAGVPGRFPPVRDLKARFLYRATANANETFAIFPVFASAQRDGFASAGVEYTSFIQSLRDAGSSPSGWCDVCQPGDLVPWCATPTDCEMTGLSPVVGGIIGAVVTAALAALAVLAYFFFERRRHSSTLKDTSSSSFSPPLATGGAKSAGTRKGPVDADVGIDEAGAPRSRIGSWEMGARAKERASSPAPPMVVGDGGGGGGDYDNDTDAASITGPPVQPRENV